MEVLSIILGILTLSLLVVIYFMWNEHKKNAQHRKRAYARYDNMKNKYDILRKRVEDFFQEDGTGKVGVVEMARRAFEYMQQCKQTKNGLLDWVFRIIIGIILGYIAVRVGLK